jgi:TolA-binding protein
MAERMGNMHLILADSFLKKGKREEAIATLQKVTKLLPGSQHAEIARARLNQLNGQPTITVDFKKGK